MNTWKSLFTLFVLLAGVAFGADTDRYERFMTTRANTLKSIYERFTVIEEKRDNSLRLLIRKSAKGEEFGKYGRIYIFTEEGHAAHPALMIVQLLEKDGDLLVKREGLTGGDRAAFQSWMNDSTKQDRADAELILGHAADAGRSSKSPASDPDAETRISKATYEYLAARDNGDFDTAYAYFAQPSSVPFKEWRDMVVSFNKVAGKVVQRQVKRVTWYTDPEGVPKGIYAAVDYESAFENIDIHCGYISWRKMPDGSFKLVREQEGHIDRASAAKLSPAQIQEFKRTQLKCKL